MAKMCPDEQAVSLYHDGELPSPWKEKLEAHLAECPECSGKLAAYRAISENLKIDDDLSAARERVWAGLGSVTNRGSNYAADRSAFWRRSINIPLPAAAAAGVLLAVFLTVAGAGRFLPSRSASPESSSVAGGQTAVADGLGPDLRNLPSQQDSAGVFRYITNQNDGDYMIMKLPDSRNFRSAGEPTLLRAADYTAGGRVR